MRKVVLRLAFVASFVFSGCSKERPGAAIEAEKLDGSNWQTSRGENREEAEAAAPRVTPGMALPDGLEGLLDEITPANASAMYEALARDPVRWRKQMGPFFRMWGAVDPTAAVAVAEKLRGKDGPSALSMALAGWGMMDFEKVRAWCDTRFPEGSGRADRYVKSILNHLPDEEIPNAADWLGNTKQSGVVLSQLGKRFGEISPAVAMEWADGLDLEPSQRSQVADIIVSDWCERDPVGCSGFLANQASRSDLREPAIAAMVRSIAPTDLEAARQWASQVETPLVRKQLSRFLQSVGEGTHSASGIVLPQ